MKPAAEFWNGQSHNHKEDPALLTPTIKPKDSERLRNFYFSIVVVFNPKDEAVVEEFIYKAKPLEAMVG